MALVEFHPEGTILPVRAHANAKQNEISCRNGDILKVSVTQAPDKGKANKAIIAVISKRLSLKKSQLELVAGATSRQKKFLVRGIKPEELVQRIESMLG